MMWKKGCTLFVKLRSSAPALLALLLALSTAFAQEEHRLAKTLLEQARFTSGSPALSAAVALNGKIVFSEGVGYADLEQQVPATGATVYRIGSVSKPMGAIAVMQLVEKGLVKVDDPIQKYVPSFPQKPNGTITLLHLLTHTSGIRHYKEGEFTMMQHFDTLDDAIKIFKDDPLKFSPGTDYSYSSYGFNLLQGVIEVAGAQVPRRPDTSGPAPKKVDLGDYMRRYVWGPAGMLSTNFDDRQQMVLNRARGYTRDSQGRILNAPYTDVSIKYIGGGVISSVEDLARLFIALDGGLLLKPETVQGMYKVHFHSTQGDRGLGWAVSVDSKQRLRVNHGGSATGFLAMLIDYPQQKLVVAALSNCDYYPPGTIAQQIADIYLAAIEANKN